MGFKSPLTILGIGVPQAVATAKGFRNVLPWWLGGTTGATAAPVGFRSPLPPFWIGGVSPFTAEVALPEGGPSDGYLTFALQEDEELIMILASFIRNIQCRRR